MSEIPGGRIPRETSDARVSNAGDRQAIPVAAPTTAAHAAHLGPYAAHAPLSRGRRHPVLPPATRSARQRARSRLAAAT
ncbi:deoxyguanosinetriphosphate triphosphohydrolase, partial [Burkholderia pseudomallei]|nr:deoxyguanosinetriphosphate triphosphohydrolase [Burkholderia pseudomallei]